MIPIFRIGVYFHVRQLLLNGLEKVSSDKIPVLHSIVKKVISRLETPDEDRELRTLSDHFGFQPLVPILCLKMELH